MRWEHDGGGHGVWERVVVARDETVTVVATGGHVQDYPTRSSGAMMCNPGPPEARTPSKNCAVLRYQ